MRIIRTVSYVNWNMYTLNIPFLVHYMTMKVWANENDNRIIDESRQDEKVESVQCPVSRHFPPVWDRICLAFQLFGDSSTISVAAILLPFLWQRFFYHFCGSGAAGSSVQVPRLAGGQGGVAVLRSHHGGRVLEYRRRLQIEVVRG